MKNNERSARLELFLDEVQKAVVADKYDEFWPLGPKQILAYFDADFLKHFYDRLNYLKKRKSKKEIAAMFADSSLLIEFLVNYACVGFKVGESLGFFKTSFKEREKFFEYIFDLIEIIDGRFLDRSDLRLDYFDFRKLNQRNFIEVNDENRALLNSFRVSIFGLNWSWYFDLFHYYGCSVEGPYYVDSDKGEVMVLKWKYYNQRPFLVWPVAEKNMFDSIVVYGIFNPIKYKLNIFGVNNDNEGLGGNLRYLYVKKDGVFVDGMDELGRISRNNFELTSKQSEYVNSLDELKQIERSMLMSYYTYRNFFGDNWKKLFEESKKNIEVLGDQFIGENDDLSGTEKGNVRNFFDPRNNIF
jgi:hypothetical protein